MTRPRISILAVALAAAAFITSSARGQDQVTTPDGRILVTDSAKLLRMGFPADARNVYTLPNLDKAERNTDLLIKTPSDFGTAAHFTPIAPHAFSGHLDLTGSSWAYGGGVGNLELTRLGTEGFADAQFLLPDGANLSGMRVWMNDTDPVNDFDFFVFESCLPPFDPGTMTFTEIVAGFGATSGSSGNQSVFFGTTRTIDNTSCTYVARVSYQAGTGSSMVLQKVRAQWNRQVSTPPATASFLDVPTSSPLFPFVEALVKSGLTAGCGGNNYCPGQAVTRGQIAVFLSTALGLYFP